jgi:hypothetical protein
MYNARSPTGGFMEGFNNKLEVGQPAMIINTRKPENRHLIGTVVKVEAFWTAGDDVTHFYKGATGNVRVLARDTGNLTVVVSGCGMTGKTSDHVYYMEPGWTNFDAKNLMPLPPLPEEEITKEKELELS